MLTALAIALLSVVAVFTAYFVVKASLFGDLQRGLREDAQKIGLYYNSGSDGGAVSQPESLRSAPTGRVVVQLYDKQGNFLASSSPQYETEAFLPQDLIGRTFEGGTVRDWQGEVLEQPVRAALAPFDKGVVVVLAATGFIPIALRKLAQSLVLTALILIGASALIAYVVAAAAIRPITQLATLAAQVDPHNLQPLSYRGPDDEVGQLGQVINDLVLRLKAALDAQRSFLAETSHELRTPLTSLQGFLERASRGADLDVQRDLADAKRIAQTMSRLVADLLQLSRGELVQELVPHLVDPYLDILQPVAEEFQGVGLTGAPGATLVGDPERLRQLVRNLTANAVRLSGDPGAVDLRLSCLAETVVLEVRDRGPGISAAELPHIFDKFYKGKGGGAGLGLAIVRQIADVHEGTLEVDSTLGEGTRFRLVLPSLEAGVDAVV